MWRSAIGARQLFTTGKAVRSLTDMKGLQIRAATSAEAKVLKDTGGVAPAFVPMSQVYMSLQKRVLDGLWSPLSTLKQFRLAEVVKYVTNTNFEVGHNKYVAINLSVWNGLPPDIQRTFEKDSAWAQKEDIKAESEMEAAGMAFAKSKGVEFINLPPDDYAKLMNIVKGIQDEMAAALDARGYPGTALLKDIRHAIAESQ